MQIVIYINNSKIKNVDCSSMQAGNPGIGGTEYCLLLLGEIYKAYYPSNKVIILATYAAKLPNVDEIKIVRGMEDAIEYCAKIKSDILIISAVEDGKPLSDSILNKIRYSKVKTIVWGHNFYLSDFATKLSNNKYITANVFVGKQQYDRYIDHSIIFKSKYIYNMYPKNATSFRLNNDGKTVTYIGSLVYHKGFHLLARVWKDILLEVPDAKLNVVGSGKLYSRNSQLGKYQIAEESYENLFMPYLIDQNGKILESVKFLGILGSEKEQIILDTSVGVINPSGRTETFGISALDFESRGVPVVTIGMGGFLDTVRNLNTGILYKHKRELSKSIIKLLKDKKVNEIYGENAIGLSMEFMPEKIIDQWDSLFKDILQEQKFKINEPNNFYFTQMKIVRIMNRRMKDILHMQWFPSVVSAETLIKKIIIKVRR